MRAGGPGKGERTGVTKCGLWSHIVTHWRPLLGGSAQNLFSLSAPALQGMGGAARTCAGGGSLDPGRARGFMGAAGLPVYGQSFACETATVGFMPP